MRPHTLRRVCNEQAECDESNCCANQNSNVLQKLRPQIRAEVVECFQRCQRNAHHQVGVIFLQSREPVLQRRWQTVFERKQQSTDEHRPNQWTNEYAQGQTRNNSNSDQQHQGQIIEQHFQFCRLRQITLNRVPYRENLFVLNSIAHFDGSSNVLRRVNSCRCRLFGSRIKYQLRTRFSRSFSFCLSRSIAKFDSSN